MNFPLAPRVCAGLLAVILMLSAAAGVPAQSQGAVKVSFKVALVDKDLNVKPVPKFTFAVEKKDATAAADAAPTASIQLVTGFDGTTSASLVPGDYVVKSEKAIIFEGKAYEWAVHLKVEDGKETVLELSTDNAAVKAAGGKERKRAFAEEAELFRELRDGVVTVEGELGHGTGFVVDQRGLILTNQHVVSKSKEIRVQFDRKHKVQAVVLAEDPEKDVAVLWANLAACQSCKVLKLADQGADSELSIIEGERIFAIGSPLSQDKILTTGVVSKVEKRAIFSDVNINPGNSGGPLFNMSGEVVGITTFAVQAESGPGVSGIIRIEEAQELLDKARQGAKDKPAPPEALMPTLPEDPFPVEAIKTRIDVKKFETKPYKAEVGAYDVMIMTPAVRFYFAEKDRIEAARDRDKRNAGSVQGTVDKYRTLRNWSEYVGMLSPVVQILAFPEVKATGKSLFMSLALGSMTGIFTPLNFKFKADFYEMELLCDGKAVTPIQRGKSEIVVPMQDYFKVKNRYTYAGIYSYPMEAFEPGRCHRLQLKIFSEEKPTDPAHTYFELRTIQRVWDDFDAYRQQQQQAATKP